MDKKIRLSVFKILSNWDSKNMQLFLWKGGSTFIGYVLCTVLHACMYSMYVYCLSLAGRPPSAASLLAPAPSLTFLQYHIDSKFFLKVKLYFILMPHFSSHKGIDTSVVFEQFHIFLMLLGELRSTSTNRSVLIISPLSQSMD